MTLECSKYGLRCHDEVNFLPQSIFFARPFRHQPDCFRPGLPFGRGRPERACRHQPSALPRAASASAEPGHDTRSPLSPALLHAFRPLRIGGLRTRLSLLLRCHVASLGQHRRSRRYSGCDDRPTAAIRCGDVRCQSPRPHLVNWLQDIYPELAIRWSAGDASSIISRSLTRPQQISPLSRREQEPSLFTIDDKAGQPIGGKCPGVNVDPIWPNIRPLDRRAPMNDYLAKIRCAVQEFLANPQ